LHFITPVNGTNSRSLSGKTAPWKLSPFGKLMTFLSMLGRLPSAPARWSGMTAVSEDPAALTDLLAHRPMLAALQDRMLRQWVWFGASFHRTHNVSVELLFICTARARRGGFWCDYNYIDDDIYELIIIATRYTQQQVTTPLWRGPARQERRARRSHAQAARSQRATAPAARIFGRAAAAACTVRSAARHHRRGLARRCTAPFPRPAVARAVSDRSDNTARAALADI
jgi:hypothetical protein